MRLPVPPREQRGGEDASPQPPCKSEFQKNTKGDISRALLLRRGRRLFDFKCVEQRIGGSFKEARSLFYKLKIECIIMLLEFIFLVKETKDGQVRRIMVNISSNAYAT